MNDRLERMLQGLAEIFGFAPPGHSASRREFLRGVAATGALAAVPVALRAAIDEEPYRKTWQVGTTLVRPSTDEVLRYAPPPHFGMGQLEPIVGSPGLFRDSVTRQVVNIRDFREEDKYDSILVPAEDAPGGAFAFFQDVEGKRAEELRDRIGMILGDHAPGPVVRFQDRWLDAVDGKVPETPDAVQPFLHALIKASVSK